MDPTPLAQAHLELHLAALNDACSAAVFGQQQEAALLDNPDLAIRSITDRQVMALLDRVNRLVAGSLSEPVNPVLAAVDPDAEVEIRAKAAASGVQLPLDLMSTCFGLTELDKRALIAVLAPELDRGYERIFAYISDEFDRRHPSVELLMTLTRGLAQCPVRRIALGPYGLLRRHRLLVEFDTAPSDLRQLLRLGSGVLEFLLGAPIDVRSIGHSSAWDVSPPLADVVCEPHSVTELARALRDGIADVVAVWGRPEAAEAAAAGIAAALGRPLSRVPALAASDPQLVDGAVRESAISAGVSGALSWLAIEPVEDPPPGLLQATADAVAAISVPIVLTAPSPWRPIGVLARRRWLETRARDASTPQQARSWRSHHPELAEEEAIDLAARFRLGGSAMAAASGLARTAARLEREDRAVSAAELTAACVTVSAPRSDRLVTVLDPHWGPRDLVLPAALHQQVVELAAFARCLPRVSEVNGTSRLLVTQRGLKALFTGEPGTGKTMAAEVIASLLGVQLVKIDLSRVVSKWVGETAKHLDAVFSVVDGSSAVLFFDEADALFGKRAEIRHGTDRYANTEVSHLLQRFEQHDGLIILASNLREQIDPAFTRRFHTVLHFPRPEEAERHRLWQLVISRQNGASHGLDLTALAALDLTGAGIVGSARTAALLAAAEGAAEMSMAHLADGVSRQFRSEGRLAPPSDLAALAELDGHPAGRRR
jgi:hypothetical protein